MPEIDRLLFKFLGIFVVGCVASFGVGLLINLTHGLR